MKYVDPTFLARSRAAFASANQSTLADVKRLAEVDKQLTATQRRDLLSALNRLEHLFQTPLVQLEASPRRMRELFASKSPAQLDLSEKTFANIRSLVVQALERYAAPALSLTRRIPIAPSWRMLLDRIETAYQRQALYRLATYCSVMGIAPDEVTPQTLLGLFEALKAEEAIKGPKSIIKNTIRTGTARPGPCPAGLRQLLYSPFKQEPYTLPLSAFPTSFQEEVGLWRERMANPDPLDDEAPARALRPATIEHRVYNFRQFASALVHTGYLPVEAITSLSVLFQPEAFKAAFASFSIARARRPSGCITSPGRCA